MRTPSAGRALVSSMIRGFRSRPRRDRRKDPTVLADAGWPKVPGPRETRAKPRRQSKDVVLHAIVYIIPVNTARQDFRHIGKSP